MKFFYTFIILCSFIVASAQDSTRVTYSITGDAKKDLVNMLPVGTYLVQSVDSIKSSPRNKELSIKLQEAIQQNMEWFKDYVKTQKEGEPMDYHPKLGLTESEYAELKVSMETVELVPVDAGLLEIFRNNNLLTFKGEGKLELLNHVTVNTTKNEITFGKYTMQISDSTSINEGKNPYISPRKGYEWTYSDPADITTVDFSKLGSLNVTSLELDICRVSTSGKTFLKFKGVQVLNGVKTMNFELPIIF